MTKYRRKTGLVDACRLEIVEGDASPAFVEWALAAGLRDCDWDCPDPEHIRFQGPYSMVDAGLGDWVIREEDGRFTAYGPDAFAARFMPDPGAVFLELDGGMIFAVVNASVEGQTDLNLLPDCEYHLSVDLGPAGQVCIAFLGPDSMGPGVVFSDLGLLEKHANNLIDMAAKGRERMAADPAALAGANVAGAA